MIHANITSYRKGYKVYLAIKTPNSIKEQNQNSKKCNLDCRGTEKSFCLKQKNYSVHIVL